MLSTQKRGTDFWFPRLTQEDDRDGDCQEPPCWYCNLVDYWSAAALGLQPRVVDTPRPVPFPRRRRLLYCPDLPSAAAASTRRP